MTAESPGSTGPLAGKRRTWLESLTVKDRNSISNQLFRMLLDAASLRVVNEARRLAPLDEEGKPKLSALVHRLLNRGFFAAQAAAIRRLTEAKNTNEKRAVLSLTRLIKDSQENTKLLTREAIFAAEGLEYDYGPIQEAGMRYAAEQTKAGESGWFTPEDRCCERHVQRYSQLDRHCAAKPAPSDNI